MGDPDVAIKRFGDKVLTMRITRAPERELVYFLLFDLIELCIFRSTTKTATMINLETSYGTFVVLEDDFNSTDPKAMKAYCKHDRCDVALKVLCL